MDTKPDFIALTPADTTRLHRFATDIYKPHYGDLWLDGGDGYLARAFAPDVLAAEIENPSTRYFFVRLGDKDAGLLKLVLTPPDLYLERLYLDGTCTGQGVGGKTLAFVDDFARACGFSRVWLKAMTYRDDVRRFYTRHGFVPCGQSKLNEPGVVPGSESMTVMEKKIV